MKQKDLKKKVISRRPANPRKTITQTSVMETSNQNLTPAKKIADQTQNMHLVMAMLLKALTNHHVPHATVNTPPIKNGVTGKKLTVTMIISLILLTVIGMNGEMKKTAKKNGKNGQTTLRRKSRNIGISAAEPLTRGGSQPSDQSAPADAL